MGKRAIVLTLVLSPVLAVHAAQAQQVRFFEKDGVTYRETRRVVNQPVADTRLETREQTVYTERWRTEMQESYQTYHTPVTEYRWVMCMRGRWNPFIQPYYTYELRPTHHWQPHYQIVRTPVTRRELVPEKRIVQVPVTTRRFAQREVITRDPVLSVATRPAAPGGIGGVARLESDPPRRSTHWRAASDTVMR